VINAVEIKRIDPDEIRLVAPLEDFDGIAMSIVMLGIEFDLTAASYEDGKGNILSPIEFFDALVVGDFIKSGHQCYQIRNPKCP